MTPRDGGEGVWGCGGCPFQPPFSTVGQWRSWGVRSPPPHPPVEVFPAQPVISAPARGCFGQEIKHTSHIYAVSSSALIWAYEGISVHLSGNTPSICVLSETWRCCSVLERRAGARRDSGKKLHHISESIPFVLAASSREYTPYCYSHNTRDPNQYKTKTTRGILVWGHPQIDEDIVRSQQAGWDSIMSSWIFDLNLYIHIYLKGAWTPDDGSRPLEPVLNDQRFHRNIL